MRAHLAVAEPTGHGIDDAYLDRLSAASIDYEQEHRFQHARDKKAGIVTHVHAEEPCTWCDGSKRDPLDGTRCRGCR